MTLATEDLVKLLLAVLVGGLIGFEREYRDKAAGFRTNIFIGLGAALFTILSLKISGAGDPLRIAANIVTGVGFLGAGTIFFNSRRVTGLTTASTIWLTAALGMGLGGGQYAVSLAAAAIALVVLWVFPFLEHRINRMHHTTTYEIELAIKPEAIAGLENQLAASRLRCNERRQFKSGERLVYLWEVEGPPKAHASFVNYLMECQDVIAFKG